MSNPAPPTNETPDFIRGWNARAKADGTTPATPPTTPTPAPDSASVLALLVSANKSPAQPINLPPGRFTIPVGLVSLSQAVQILGHSTVLVLTHAGAPATSSTGIGIHADGVEISGISFDSDRPIEKCGPDKINITAIRVYAKVAVSDCNFANVDNAVFFEATGSGTVTNCHADKTMRSDPFFVGGARNVKFLGCSSVGSTCEHGARVDTNGLNGANTAGDITFEDCDFGTLNSKEGLAIRTAIGPVYVLRSRFNNATLRGGQEAKAPAPAPSKIVKLIVQGCKFAGPNAFITIVEGVYESLIGAPALEPSDLDPKQSLGNSFQDCAGYCPVHFAGPNIHVTGFNNRLLPGPGGNGDTVMKKELSAGDVADVRFV